MHKEPSAHRALAVALQLDKSELSSFLQPKLDHTCEAINRAKNQATNNQVFKTSLD